MAPVTVLFLCRDRDLRQERAGYQRALARLGVDVCCITPQRGLRDHLATLIDDCPDPPIAVVQVEGSIPFLPRGLAQSSVTTACFHIDTFEAPDDRARQSMLFDHVFVFHPGFEEHFGRQGHPSAHLLPHAVDPHLFGKPGSHDDRRIEVAWVGNLEGPPYSTRRRLVPLLATSFRMNEWWRWHSLPEMADVYRRAKIGLNIGQDRWPQDANQRVFEIMASGALLVTAVPSELEQLGFVEGRHFVGVRDERELLDVVSEFLAHEDDREEIARAGRELVLATHTYDHRASRLLEVLCGSDRAAPARSWDSAPIERTYLGHWIRHRQRARALGAMTRLTFASPREAVDTASYWLGRRLRRRKNRQTSPVGPRRIPE